jgi:uncharacterized protein
MDSADRPRRAQASPFYLAAEIFLVLALGAILVKAVPLAHVLEGGWAGRFYSPVRILVLIGFIAWLLSLTGQNWRDMGVRRPDSWPRAIGLGVTAFVVIFLIDQIVVRSLLRAADFPEANISGFSVITGNVWEFLYWAGPMTWLVGGIGEEFIGRAYLISRLAAVFGGSSRTNWAIALVLASIVFGLGHAYQGVSGMISTGVGGALYGLVYLLAGRNIWPAVIAHGLADVLGFTAIFAGVADMGGG